MILQGRTFYPTCNAENPIEVAIDGAFTNFRYVEFMSTQGITEIEIPRLQIRVVLRDGRVRIAVVTVYPIQDPVDLEIPEVDDEIW